eukprot:2180481-Ditylum_brightwellii.AAC.1
MEIASKNERSFSRLRGDKVGGMVDLPRTDEFVGDAGVCNDVREEMGGGERSACLVGERGGGGVRSDAGLEDSWEDFCALIHIQSLRRKIIGCKLKS